MKRLLSPDQIKFIRRRRDSGGSETANLEFIHKETGREFNVRIQQDRTYFLEEMVPNGTMTDYEWGNSTTESRWIYLQPNHWGAGDPEFIAVRDTPSLCMEYLRRKQRELKLLPVLTGSGYGTDSIYLATLEEVKAVIAEHVNSDTWYSASKGVAAARKKRREQQNKK